MVTSSDEFLLQIKNTTRSDQQKLVSLDVTSLFTNVPIDRTIDIILESVYSHGTLPAPEISSDDLRSLLEICTKETPFKHGDQEFIQVDGVSMGSPLGPTFADFYMSHVESTLLSQTSF